MPRAKIDQLKKDIEPAPSCHVQMKKMGNITEVRYMRRTQNGNIRKVNKENYVLVSTGEVKKFQHTETRADSKASVAQSLAHLRDLLNTNIVNTEQCRWLTLTYRENMKDTKRLYEDAKKFHMRLRYYLRRKGLPSYEYIECCEPQARGSWHMHIVIIFSNVIKSPYIPNDALSEIWGHGFTKIKALKDVDNVGLYLTAYLTDMELSESFQCGNTKGDLKAVTIKDDHGNKLQKAIVKGARLSLYPPGFRIYRTSRGIKKPEIVKCTEAEAMEEVGTASLVFERTIRISNGEYGFNVINYRQFNKTRKSQQEGTARPDGKQ